MEIKCHGASEILVKIVSIYTSTFVAGAYPGKDKFRN
jgi:hypothetical protein